ncbi:hypothetical protein [Streptomyces ramulosus]|uniref:Translation initiation factor IF-2 n=1 Tax=Streptomyces ramulosus TaxID=47762 RepID=A0ABW1FE62_9ACTN
MGHSAATPPTGPDGPLARLAAERATGALHFPGGRIRLRDGAVSWVECDDLPGSAAPAPPREGGRSRRPRQGRAARGAAGTSGADGQAHTSGDTGPENLTLRQIRHVTVLLDAAFLVLPLPEEGTSFTPGAEHCPAAVRQVGVAALLRAVAVRRAQLDAWRTWAAVDGAPVVLAPDTRREDGPGWRARLLLAAADGRRTPAGLAQALGHSVFWTLLEVRRLAAGGLVALPEGATAAGGTEPTGGTAPAGGAGTSGGKTATGGTAATGGRKAGGGTAAGGGKAGNGTAGGGKAAGRAAAAGSPEKTGSTGAAGSPEASGGRSAGRSGGATTRAGRSGRPRGGEKRSGTAGRERSGPDKRSGTAPPLPTRGADGGREGGLPTRGPAGGRSGGPASRAAGRERETERPTHSAADDGGEAPGALPRRRPGVCLEEAREREPQPSTGTPGLPAGLPETADPDVTLLTRLRTALEENL